MTDHICPEFPCCSFKFQCKCLADFRNNSKDRQPDKLQQLRKSLCRNAFTGSSRRPRRGQLQPASTLINDFCRVQEKAGKAPKISPEMQVQNSHHMKLQNGRVVLKVCLSSIHQFQPLWILLLFHGIDPTLA